MLKRLLNNHVEPLMRIFLLLSLLDLVVGAVSMIIYGILTVTYGVTWIRNQYFGLWLTSLIFFHAIQSVYIEVKKWPKMLYYINDLIFTVISIILSLLMCIFYGLGHKIDVIIWSIYIITINSKNLYILIVRKKNNVGRTEVNEIEIKDFDSTKSSNRRSQHDSSSKSKGCIILTRILRVINIILRFFFIIIMCLLLNGAIVDGIGYAKFKTVGKTIDVALNDNSGRSIKINFLCDGPVDSSKSIFMFEGSASHSLSDYLSLQTLLKENNRRSCIWDKPGLGFSDYLYTDFKSFMTFYDNMINGFGEKGSFSFVGWGGGGEIIYEYASKYPQKVKDLTFLDTAPNNIEFEIPRILKNWTQNQYDEYKSRQISSRFQLFRIINGLGVPWGLMSILTPASQSDTYYKQFSEQIRWSFLNEKTWITQEFYLSFSSTAISPFKLMNISQTIPINIIMSKKSDQQIKDNVCKNRKLDPDSPECKFEIDSNNLMNKMKSDLLNLSKNGKLIECTEDVCNLGYFVGVGANYTVSKLLTI